MQVGVSAVVSSLEDIEFVRDCELVGATSVWVPEAWGYDALTPLAHLAAVTSTLRLATGIVQVGARSPAMLAMQAMSVQQLSGGRLVLGLGSSGPRIMEAWHGVPFRKPVATMRETLEDFEMDEGDVATVVNELRARAPWVIAAPGGGAPATRA